jgi:S-adenosylmethionine:tRNA ribosyltransferase-isomerase
MMKAISFDSEIHISDYNYPLPDERIALFPATSRDKSKLLVYKDGEISDAQFDAIGNYLPENSLLVLNNTRVIHARLLFEKVSGARIEIFCLEPVSPQQEIQLAMQQTGSCVWKCYVGNAKKWKSGILQMNINSENKDLILFAEVIEKSDDTYHVQFSWQPSHLTFAHLLECAGKIPLPPYIHRAAQHSDEDRYQTVFAKQQGSVAAPTAGLHFTQDIFEKLKSKNISAAQLTLHVGAGTFKPISSEKITDHHMHEEQVVVTKDFLEVILKSNKKIIAVGTTSVRSLESLYWLGLTLKHTGFLPEKVSQWDPYNELQHEFSSIEILQELLGYLMKNNLSELHFQTSIIIVPGYRFKIIQGMVTNFHQPQSTLLLLIAAFLGDDWKRIYEHALRNDYRFLSYGDACLFL